MDPQTEKFNEWCMVELFGHQRMAGLVQPSMFPDLLRVDVFLPGKDKPEFTRLINTKAVYALNPIEESVCRDLAQRYKPQPVQSWEISNLLLDRNPAQASQESQNDEPF